MVVEVFCTAEHRLAEPEKSRTYQRPDCTHPFHMGVSRETPHLHSSTMLQLCRSSRFTSSVPFSSARIRPLVPEFLFIWIPHAINGVPLCNSH